MLHFHDESVRVAIGSVSDKYEIAYVKLTRQIRYVIVVKVQLNQAADACSNSGRPGKRSWVDDRDIAKLAWISEDTIKLSVSASQNCFPVRLQELKGKRDLLHGNQMIANDASRRRRQSRVIQICVCNLLDQRYSIAIQQPVKDKLHVGKDDAVQKRWDAGVRSWGTNIGWHNLLRECWSCCANSQSQKSE